MCLSRGSHIRLKSTLRRADYLARHVTPRRICARTLHKLCSSQLSIPLPPYRYLPHQLHCTPRPSTRHLAAAGPALPWGYHNQRARAPSSSPSPSRCFPARPTASKRLPGNRAGPCPSRLDPCV
ncbi:uncharacterized protein TRAVEDRAFT_59339, partial [Trametes versicolor FP-101664 SS1]|uniref:uncharacterized protein n=1 Tax=Trametes versicolor (strain FP-101664) TaxID=717944 RepID=UPI0004622EE8